MVRCRVRRQALAFVAAMAVVAATGAAPGTLPDRLSDEEFWSLSQTLSEPNGYFRSDNLLSNELYYPDVLSELVARVKPGGVYLGVGPEQNFNYIVAVRPRIAFITDVRRGNLHAQLMYKALFELSADRAEFVSRLFSKPRPEGLAASSTAGELMEAYWEIPTSAETVFDTNLRDIQQHLTKTRRLPLSEADLEGIASVYHAFYWYGPSISYSSSNSGGRWGRMVNYAQLMSAVDDGGAFRSYLASEETFRVMKEIESRNLVVPVVGNFAGPRALRAIGDYVRERGASVDVFYLSNVEQYLRQDGIHDVFCANVASMPLTGTSTFIRSQSWGGGTFRNMLGDMMAETLRCAVASASGGR